MPVFKEARGFFCVFHRSFWNGHDLVPWTREAFRGWEHVLHRNIQKTISTQFAYGPGCLRHSTAVSSLGRFLYGKITVPFDSSIGCVIVEIMTFEASSLCRISWLSKSQVTFISSELAFRLFFFNFFFRAFRLHFFHSHHESGPFGCEPVAMESLSVRCINLAPVFESSAMALGDWL